MILVCGATGLLGGRIAHHLAVAGVPVRALVRPATDASVVEYDGVEIVRGDLRVAASLGPALVGVEAVVTTANALGRALNGERALTIHDVDEVGNASLIAAAERAGVRRFVFLSGGDPATFVPHTPFTDAKLATERRLDATSMEVVIVRPDVFQEIWFSPLSGFDPAEGSIRIYGSGRSRLRFVSVDDVAQAVARVAVMEGPPRELILGGAEAMSMREIAARCEVLAHRPMKVSHVPRVALRMGAMFLRPFRPPLASMLGMALSEDLRDSTLDDAGFRLLGISPRPVSAYLAQVVAGS